MQSIHCLLFHFYLSVRYCQCCIIWMLSEPPSPDNFTILRKDSCELLLPDNSLTQNYLLTRPKQKIGSKTVYPMIMVHGYSAKIFSLLKEKKTWNIVGIRILLPCRHRHASNFCNPNQENCCLRIAILSFLFPHPNSATAQGHINFKTLYTEITTRNTKKGYLYISYTLKYLIAK